MRIFYPAIILMLLCGHESSFAFTKLCGDLQVRITPLVSSVDDTRSPNFHGKIDICFEVVESLNHVIVQTPNFNFVAEYTNMFETSKSALIVIETQWHYRLAQILARNAQQLNIAHLSDVVLSSIPNRIKVFFNKRSETPGSILSRSSGAINLYLDRGGITQKPKYQDRVYLKALGISEGIDFSLNIEID